MNISPAPEFEAMISAKVESGKYNDARDVVIQALRVLQREEQMERMRAKVQIGLQAIEEERTVADTPELRKALKKEAILRAKAGIPISDAIKPWVGLVHYHF